MIATPRKTGGNGNAASQRDDPFLRRELGSTALVAARAVVLGYAVVLLVIYLRWLPRWLQDQAAVAASAARSSGSHFPFTAAAIATSGLAIVAGLAWIALAALVFLRRSRDLFGLILAAGFLSFGVIFTGFQIIGMERSDPWGWWPFAILLVANFLSMPWVFLFPDGRFVPRWTIALAVAWLGVTLTQAPGAASMVQTPVGMTGINLLTYLLITAGVTSLVYRYWRRSTAVQRQQLKWLVLGGLAFLAVYMLLVPTGELIAHADQPSQAFHARTTHLTLLSLAVIGIPITLGIAIFRQGLLDIDFIINRTLTYGAVTVILALALVIIGGAANLLLEATTGQRSQLVLLAAVVPVALAFMPLRTRALAIADQFVSDRKVMTLLFVDLVASTERAYALGDRAWRDLLLRFRSAVRRCLRHYGGREIDTAGDGFFITFDAPGQAIRCARELVETVRPLGLEVRVGVHIGEVQVDRSHVTGAAVHVASRVMAEAGSGEVLVSRALRNVVAGSDLELTERGIHHLKGVPGEMQLFAARA